MTRRGAGRVLAFSLTALFWSVSVFAQPIRVFVAPAPHGFVDAAAKTRTETLKLLNERLAKKKTLVLVPAAEQAQITIDLTSVAMVDGALQTRANPLGGGAETKAAKEYEGKAVLTVGDYHTDLVRRSPFTAIIAAKLADDVDQWIKDNRTQLH